MANEISRWRNGEDSKGIGLTTRPRATSKLLFLSRRYVRASCAFYLCLTASLPCRLFTGVHRLAVIIVGIHAPPALPFQHPASDARYSFAASRRRRPSLNLILTDERRGESSDGRYAGKWPEKLDTPSLRLAIFLKDPLSLFPPHNASIELHKYDFLSDQKSSG